VTELLADWREGKPGALDRLWPVVQDELHQLAKRHVRKERSGHTLQTTALVNEVYLKLVSHQDVGAKNRGQFFTLAAHIMRCLLVDYARNRNYLKRGGGKRPVSLDAAALVSQVQSDEVLAVDEALARLALIDQRKSQIVELRYFAGLDVEEAAEALAVSPITVKREWRKAKAWLHRELTEADDA
jgi:RNA polymerase sigma factor (TIGR02999 family)